MARFVLVHGAWHGAWCWERVAEGLRAAGHGTVMVNLPCDVVTAGWVAYRDVAVSAIGGNFDDLVVVGHSLGGGVIPLVAAKVPVRRMVFVGCTPPEPERSLNEVVDEEAGLTDERALLFKDSVDNEGRYVWRDFESAQYAMYHDCPVRDAIWAFGRLRPQAVRPFQETWPLTEWPDLPITFVVCTEDRMGRATSLRRIARRRFGIDAVELPGGHSPFISRPAAVVQMLLGLVN